MDIFILKKKTYFILFNDEFSITALYLGEMAPSSSHVLIWRSLAGELQESSGGPMQMGSSVKCCPAYTEAQGFPLGSLHRWDQLPRDPPRQLHESFTTPSVYRRLVENNVFLCLFLFFLSTGMLSMLLLKMWCVLIPILPTNYTWHIIHNHCSTYIFNIYVHYNISTILCLNLNAGVLRL